MTALALCLLFLLLFASLEQRPLDAAALRHFPEEVLARGRQFAREARLAGTIQALLSLGALLFLCFHRTGARWLTWLETQGRGRLWKELLWVSGGIALVTALVELPLAFYLGFLHERAYGLTGQTAPLWLAEHLARLLLQFVLSLLLWLPLYWLIRRSPGRWWLPATGLTAAFSAVLTMLYPVLLLPLFNEITPVQDPAVLVMVERLAGRAGVAVTQVRELKVGAKSTRLNAMVTGMGPTKQMVLYSNLIQQLSPAELEVVLAHELAHAVHGDLSSGWLLATGMGAVSLAGAAWMLRRMRGVAPLAPPAPHAARSLALLILFLSLFDYLAGPVQNGFSRQLEVRADRYAQALTQNPRAMVTSFQKLALANPGDVAPHPTIEFLAHSHPSILRRIQRALAEVR